MDKQRETTLRSFFSKSASSLRPIFTSINGEQGWVFSFPIPRSERATRGKVYYHIVIDPWIAGQVNINNSAPWIMNISIQTPAYINTGKGVEECAEQIDRLVEEYLSSEELAEFEATRQKPRDDGYEGTLDTILIPWHYPDHIHEESLVQFDKRIPIILTDAGAAIVRPWNHFNSIVKLQDLASDAKTWQTPGLRPEAFPTWLTCFMINRVEKYTYALVWSHPNEDSEASDEEVHESIFASPHGTWWNQELENFTKLSPPTNMLAFQNPLKSTYAIYGCVGIGAEGALEIYRKLGGAKYWIPTHHSPLVYQGILATLLRLSQIFAENLDAALKKEKDAGLLKGEDPNLVHVDNGGCFVLE